MTLAERADSLPSGPGVYWFKNARGTTLYVGKAQDLRSRVRQYLSGGDGRIQIPKLMQLATDVDVLVTDSVKDALLLENELIKRYRPVFNVRLRDDKQYLALRIDPREPWPRVREVRRFHKDGARYFGPYTSSLGLREVLGNLRRIFPLRSCRDGTFKDYARRGRPCIEFEMKRCLGPCCDLVDPASYAELVDGTILFLQGRSSRLVKELGAQMRIAAAAERFEEAGRLRDRIAAIEGTIERQMIVAKRSLERDVFGLARRGDELNVQVLHMREGRVVDGESYRFSEVLLDDGVVMASFLGQYYGGDPEQARSAPREILVSAPIDDDGATASFLSERRGRSVSIRKPQRGSPRDLVTLATRNAELALERRLAERDSIEVTLHELKKRCSLTEVPRRIECYDVSTLGGTLAVASRVVFVNGEPDKSSYRRYRIREAAAGDDYACLREVLQRRLARVSSDPLPDLLMVDGGRGQVGVVRAVLQDLALAVDHLGLSKERDADSPSRRVKRGGGLKAERVVLPGRANPLLLRPNSKALLLLQRIRDESHRFAIEFQRKLRSKVGLTSILEELPGIGPKKKRSLLRELGSLRAVREADRERLVQVTGISARDAETIAGFFSAQTRTATQGDAPD